MDRIEYRDVVDRTGWAPGPWDGEPDKVQWPDAATGLPCVIVRHRHFGNLCGYVGVPSGHSLHGREYGEWEDIDRLEVHGGITYSAPCQHGGEASHAICHIAGPGEPDHVFWFGFDCSHAWDRLPAMEARERERGGRLLPMAGAVYRDWAYVGAECTELARQLAALTSAEARP